MTLHSTPLPFSCPIDSTSEAPGYTNIQSTGNPLIIHLICSCFSPIIPFQGGKGPEPLPAYVAHILRSSPFMDITSTCIHTCGHFHFTCEVGEINTNTSRTLTPHREVNISRQKGSEGSLGWFRRPGTHPVPSPWLNYQAESGHPLPDTRHPQTFAI